MSSLCAISINLVVFVLLIAAIEPVFPSSLRYPLPVSVNRITRAALQCDSASVNATITLQNPFKGLLFAKDFSHECSSIGTLSNTVSISLPTSGCGVRLTSRSDASGHLQMIFSVVLVIQQDRFLKQISDQEKYFECQVSEDAFLIKSSSSLSSTQHRAARTFKTGDAGGHFEITEALQAARAWMEISPLNSPENALQVGETAVLSVKTTLPPGIGWKVVDCQAKDGLGDSSQKLLDDAGCPIDENLLPVPEFGDILPISLMKHQEATARFAAFKFPDRDRLHLTCQLELCRGNCQFVDCKEGNELKVPEKGEQGEILDRLEVFNSVEVLAPSIDEFDNIDSRLRSNDPVPNHFRHFPGTNETFCVSPDKIAITFCVLGVIFLCAVIIAACALLKSRRSGQGGFYTRSLFSSSSGGSAYGSKLLLHESPCMGQSSSAASRVAMPYRIL